MGEPTWWQYQETHGEAPPPGTTLTCPTCGKAFVTTNKTNRYCSVLCRRKYHYDQQRKPAEQKTCLRCGAPFVAKQSNYRYCSQECARAAKQEREAPKRVALTPDEEVRQREYEQYERRIRQETGRTVILVELLKDYCDRFKAHDLTPVPYVRRRGKAAETMVVCRGDLHPGLVTPSYNIEVFLKRMELFTQRVLRIHEIINETAPIERLVIFDLGDCITGQGIFPGQSWVTDRNVMEQIYIEGAPSIIRQNRTWLENFPFMEEHSIPGNHGRTGKEHPEAVNWDNVLAQEILARMERLERYRIDVQWHWWKYAEIYGWRFLLLHGNQIRGWLNIPFYGLIQKSMRWQGSMPERWHYMVHGHFHVPFAFPWNNYEIIGNGTLVSDDDFGLRELGMSSRPAQQVFGVHPKHGITWRYTLILDDEKGGDVGG